MMQRCIWALAGALGLLMGCGQTPIKPSESHLKAEPERATGTIPAPVRIAPVVPEPKPTQPPETYSVVVHNVPVQELLFALARDAHVQVDLHPGITGNVTLNAIDQTLPQLLKRIARQIDMRYEIDGQTLVVERDTPYLRIHRVDYVNQSRESQSQSSLATQVSGASSGGGGGANNSSSSINSKSTNKFWDTLIKNVTDILRETDRILPAGAATPAATPVAAAAGGASGGSAPAAAPASASASTFREAASVIANPEAGILSIRATSRQHERIQEFLDQVMVSARRQVLLEATIAEVQLNNQYQRGIDWTRVRRGASGITLRGSSAGTPAGVATTALVIDAAAASINFQATIRLLESFGDVRVLSSPKVTVLNNQAASLRVGTQLVYFSIQPSTSGASATGGGVVNAPATFTTTPNTVLEGITLSVVPQISGSDSIMLSIRPSVTRKIRDVSDPNPGLIVNNPAGGQTVLQNNVPEMLTQEMESILEVRSGEIAVLGGLMQDRVDNTEDSIPGLRSLPGLGELFEQRKDLNRKTELVIFLRPTVVRDASVSGDFRDFRRYVPGSDFFTKPDPSRVAPPVMPKSSEALTR